MTNLVYLRIDTATTDAELRTKLRELDMGVQWSPQRTGDVAAALRGFVKRRGLVSRYPNHRSMVAEILHHKPTSACAESWLSEHVVALQSWFSEHVAALVDELADGKQYSDEMSKSLAAALIECCWDLVLDRWYAEYRKKPRYRRGAKRQ
jgi:hypothetical protein